VNPAGAPGAAAAEFDWNPTITTSVFPFAKFGGRSTAIDATDDCEIADVRSPAP
jgi:hypothetical protein